MKRCIWALALFLMMVGVAFAAQAENTDPIADVDLGTYGGIALLTTILVGTIKKFFPIWMKGKEPYFAIGLPLLLGVVGKATAAGFADINWVNHVVALLISGITSGLIHDKIVNPLIKGREQPPPE